MSDDEIPKPPKGETADEIRARIAGKKLAVEPAADEPQPVVISFLTGKPIKASKLKRRGKKKRPLVSAAMVDGLKMLLKDAKAGKITSISYIVSGPEVACFTGNLLAVDGPGDDVERLALQHMGALKFVEEELADVASGLPHLEFDDDEDEPA